MKEFEPGKMSELTKKIQIRGGHRLHVKKVISKINELADSDGERQTARLEALKAELVKQQTRIDALDCEIEELFSDESSIEQEIVGKCEFGSLIEETVSYVNSILCKTKSPVESSSASSKETSVATGNLATVTNATTSKVKLPKFSLPSFDGDSTKWLSQRFMKTRNSVMLINFSICAVVCMELPPNLLRACNLPM